MFQRIICLTILLPLTLLGTGFAQTTLQQNTGSKTIVSIHSIQDLDIIRTRIINNLLEPTVNVSSIKTIVQTIQPNGSWLDINYVDTSLTGFQHRIHLERMLELSISFRKPGNPLYQDVDVKKTVFAALDFWLMKDFRCQNWWWNEMGTPSTMINILLLLDENLSDIERLKGLQIAGRASLDGFGARPGGDLIPIAGMLGKQGLLKRDVAIVDKVIKTMAAQVQISEGRGIQADKSFHHRTDNVISTLSYGSSFAETFAYWAATIAGTSFSFPDTALHLLTDYYLDGISRSMAFGKMPDIGAKNRDLTRKETLNPIDAKVPIYLLQASDYRKKELENLVALRTGKKASALAWSNFFWHSEYYTHQQPRWFSSVRMHSSRQSTMEQPHNEEGLKNHHFADGSNFLTLTGDEYVDVFPVWDWQKIPGATIVQKPQLPHWKQIAKPGISSFVGGVSNGKFGAAVNDFISALDSLQARKSWFFFQDEYVCLGAAIHSTAPFPVFTTLNQSNLQGDVVIKNNSTPEILQKGVHQLSDLSWVFHDGVAYVFPQPVALTISNTTATGSWREINHQDWASAEKVTRDLFTAWLDHGLKPEAAQYAYIVLPAIKPNVIDRYQNKSSINILSNTSALQAVQNKKLQITQAVFYVPGTIALSENIQLKAENPCMAMVEMHKSKIIRLTVSDPSRKLQTLKLVFSRKVKIDAVAGQSVYDVSQNETHLEVILPIGLDAGKSIVLTVQY